MAMNKWMARLNKNENAVKRDQSPFSNYVRYSSPYLNWLFGNTHGLPKGKKMVVWGGDKAGKTVMRYDMIGQIHRDYPKADVICYDTESRDDAQLTPALARAFGIDLDRYVCHITNKPEEIFDHFENEVVPAIQDGQILGALFIDSITAVMGRRMQSAEGIMTRQIGDDATTQADGLKRILTYLNKYKIPLILTAQVRAEMDPNKAKYKPYKMAGAWYLKHSVEYTIKMERVSSKEGGQTLTGGSLEDASLTDVMGNAERTGHRIRATMENSSLGPSGRKCEFTFNYREGVVNRYEEAFQLGITRGIVDRPNNRTYVLSKFPAGSDTSMKWDSKGDFLLAISKNEDLYNEIIQRVKLQDVDLMDNGAESKFYMPSTEPKQEDADE